MENQIPVVEERVDVPSPESGDSFGTPILSCGEARQGIVSGGFQIKCSQSQFRKSWAAGQLR